MTDSGEIQCIIICRSFVSLTVNSAIKTEGRRETRIDEVANKNNLAPIMANGANVVPSHETTVVCIAYSVN